MIIFVIFVDAGMGYTMFDGFKVIRVLWPPMPTAILRIVPLAGVEVVGRVKFFVGVVRFGRFGGSWFLRR